MTIAVCLSIRSFYKVYIEDDDCSITDEEAKRKANEIAMRALQTGDRSELSGDIEMPVEEDDVTIGQVYSF